MMTIIQILLWGILVYFVALHLIYLLLVFLGASHVRRYEGGITFAEFDRIAKSELSMPVSVIVPAHNEEAIIVNTVENVLKLNYPEHEVIVVDDGSTDGTVAVLREHFGLRQVDKQGRRHIDTRTVHAVYESETHPNLTVAQKDNGRRADAINAGASLARYPLLCVVDADCVIEPDGLLHMARPFLVESRLAASAGVVRPSNGLTVENGTITRRGLPRTLLGLNQEIEYARSFQWARTGLSRLRSMLCISGALLLVKKSVFEAAGGPWPQSITDDMEFAIRLNGHIYDRHNGRNHTLAFTPGAVCYTEVPEDWRQYASQRNRWQRGTLQSLFRHWRMLFNPRYGLTGVFGMPFFLFFEALAPLVEILAYTLAVILLVAGVATAKEVLILLFLAYSAGVFITLLAVLLNESSRWRTATWGEFWKMVGAIFLDHLGFHQYRLVCSLVGTFQYIFLRRRDLGTKMERLTPATAAP
jgi:cellulose synthase/poly-beta-1,6-N-acetylglucosamine synthase-like glycosyltransferase